MLADSVFFRYTQTGIVIYPQNRTHLYLLLFMGTLLSATS